MYGFGFKSSGVRQMCEELNRLHTRLLKAAKASSDLTMGALGRKYNELKCDVDHRPEVAFCQAISALVTCFQQIMFLCSVESLLSIYGNELGMLGDTETAVKELGRVLIELRSMKSPRATAFRVSITSRPSGIVVELPIITRRASEYLSIACIQFQARTQYQGPFFCLF
ncbi:unnamed protein product [Hyaloperonospora brassicae]|uniref:Uncharacterized protein n=2 Tax=Hyaloperonospora brassicae TaxID=162125 RepID=A0AAV0TV39_HYABA|nr:unnamed protein product [Hyaloperonospora brassicae]